MSIISYAQNHEDVILWRALKHIESGFYVDVGANDPVDDSVTKTFYDNGWSGINIEPSHEYFVRLEQERLRDINLSCVVGEKDEMVTFYESSTRGWSTSDKQVGKYYRDRGQATTKELQQLCLNTILERHTKTDIHFLKIDVEGTEASVIAGLNFERYRPWIIIIESLNPITKLPEYESWEKKVLRSDYDYTFFDGLNRYYVAKEHEELKPAFASPPNVLDSFQTNSQVQLSAAIAEGQAEIRRIQQVLVTRDQELGSQIVQGKAEALRLTQQMATREQELGAQLNFAQAEIAASHDHAQRLEKERDLAKAKIDELNHSSHHWWTVADRLNRGIQEIYASRSWRITLPLRKTSLLVKKSRQPIKAGLGLAFRIPRRAARYILRHSMAYVNNHSKLRATALKLLNHTPVTKAHLKAFSLAHPIISDPRVSSLHQAVMAKGTEEQNLPTCSDNWISPTPNVIIPKPQGSRTIYCYVDHTIHCPVNTGMQRVTRRLASALIEAGELVRFVKWDGYAQQVVLLNHEELDYLSKWNGPVLSKADLQHYPTSNDTLVPVAKCNFQEGNWLVVSEVTHITYQEQPMTLNVLMAAKHLGLKTAFVFYDAIPLRRNDLRDMAPKHESYMQQLLLADLIVPISHWSSRDLVSFFHVHEQAVLTPTPRIQAIPLPGESHLASRISVPIKPSETKKLILSVGTISPHKNQLALVHAFEKYCEIYPETDWRLVLVGNLHPAIADEINRAAAQDSRIEYLHHAPDDVLVELYRASSFTVFPSVEEGFGLPILESLWYARPCICANFGSMSEVAEGGGCFTINTHDPKELLNAITRMTMDPELLRSLSEEASVRSMSSWDNYSSQFKELLDKASNPLAQLGVIYYWVDHTVGFYRNTGIQRVVRGLARALLELGFKLVPVKWDQTTARFCAPSPKELEYLAKWNGPEVSAWSSWNNPSTFALNDWLLIPELILYLNETRLAELKQYISVLGLRCSWIFYDAIPWKMQDIFPKEFSESHRRYMEWLSEFDLILPISHFSRNDLISFLAGTSRRTLDLENLVQTCELPGEFHESSRITVVKRTRPGVIKVLCVGTVEPRKNHLNLLQAFVKTAAQTTRPIELCIVGRSTEPALADKVKHYVDVNPIIRWEQDADDARLRELFAECDYTVYPSVEEGFGLPILESLWNARPCICRNSGAMAEVAVGGGCLMVEVINPDELAQAMLQLAEDDNLRAELASEAVIRPFKTWRDYAREVAIRLATERYVPLRQSLPESMEKAEFYEQFINLQSRPLLSICITTYNRAEWLAVSLKNLARLLPNPCAEIEIVVCDNTSPDNTSEVVKPYFQRADFSYYRNPVNVGMLGNLRVTAHHARGQYIWILGDDDLIKRGSIEKIVKVIQEHPDLAMVYLNYAYTREDDAKSVLDLDKFLNEGIPIVTPGPDIVGPVKRISTESENFFTAIYCQVLRRDHALRAYSQNTEGRPFSTMLTCIPTTNYVLHFMMNEPAYWMGEPQLVVNLNVSWIKYAPLWILERIPEVYDLAERMGAEPQSVDRWRIHNLPGVDRFFQEIYDSDKEGNMSYFSPARLMGRIKHLEEFPQHAKILRVIYEAAYAAGHPGAKIPPSQIFASLNSN